MGDIKWACSVIVALTFLITSLRPGWTPCAIGGVCEITPSETWKNSFEFPEDPFRVPGDPLTLLPGWVKFTILTCRPNQVYFQNSRLYSFHYHFATENLDPFMGSSPEEFNLATLHEMGQQAILGAVLMPAQYADFAPLEFGIQLVRQDPYQPQEIVDIFELVKSHIQTPDGGRAFYFPTFEQLPAARVNEQFLATHGIEISSPARWADGNISYSNGWALGTLKFFPASEIDSAFRDGRLEPADILLTDAIPAEIPFVAGIISLSPSTPNSHVAILANNFGIPFVHLALEEDAKRAQNLIGNKTILLSYSDSFSGTDIRLYDIEGILDAPTIDGILGLKELPPLTIEAIATSNSFSLPVKDLELSDIRHVGGKAAGYSLLLEAIPDNSRLAAAFTFDLWNTFLDQTVPSGNTLRQDIETLLLPYNSYPPSSVSALAADLAIIRDWFKDDTITSFSSQLRTAVINTLEDSQFEFNPLRKIRFRSSTNMEDSDHFTGAGLFNSVSGCLEDDLDGDMDGPSACDPERLVERGVFRAIRRVWASFYNDNAFLERLRWNMNEQEVGMAVLVHHSFPDETELANGVATLTKRGGPTFDIKMVTQLGAVSVSNPMDGSLPEEVDVFVFSSGSAFPTLLRESNLTILGDTVLEWQDDYATLAGLLVEVARLHEAKTGILNNYVLDYEYKKIVPGDLIVKQIRQIPLPDNTPSITPFLLNEPMEYCIFQGEEGDLFGNHRLKSYWSFETKSMWLTEENLSTSIYTDVSVEYTNGCDIFNFSAPLADFPEASNNGAEEDSWRFGDLPNPGTYHLSTPGIPTLVAPSESPILTQRDFNFDGRKVVTVEYETPVNNGNSNVNQDLAVISPCLEDEPIDTLQVRTAIVDNVTVETQYIWRPESSTSASAGYTAPLVRWQETVITGLTAEPIVLHDKWSQTYRPEHHNIGENFVFSPSLEPDISDDILAELDSKNIHLIHLPANYGNPNDKIIYHGACELGHTCACTVRFLRGDCNGDSTVNIADGSCTLNWLFLGTADPRCIAAVDPNGNGSTNIADVSYLLNFLFLGGPDPIEPFPNCAESSLATDATLGCQSPPAPCE